jgi:KDO2-lipid IV(A) lauroyltransferase
LSKVQQQDLIKKSLIETGKGLSESGFVWFNSFKHNAKHIVKTKGAQYLKGDENTLSKFLYRLGTRFSSSNNHFLK